MKLTVSLLTLDLVSHFCMFYVHGPTWSFGIVIKTNTLFWYCYQKPSFGIVIKTPLFPSSSQRK